MALRVRFAEEDGEPVLWAAGELDITVAAQLGDALDRVRARPGLRLIVDLSQLGFLDVSGLRLLITADERLRRGGAQELAVRGAAGIVRRIFEVVGTTSLLADPAPTPSSVAVPMPRQVARTS
jgi:anti-sigma B factor antagonist